MNDYSIEHVKDQLRTIDLSKPTSSQVAGYSPNLNYLRAHDYVIKDSDGKIILTQKGKSLIQKLNATPIIIKRFKEFIEDGYAALSLDTYLRQAKSYGLSASEAKQLLKSDEDFAQRVDLMNANNKKK